MTNTVSKVIESGRGARPTRIFLKIAGGIVIALPFVFIIWIVLVYRP